MPTRPTTPTTRHSEEQAPDSHRAASPSRRKRAALESSNEAVLHAFADALRDILRDEHRTAVA
jgi:hypothetical protein